VDAITARWQVPGMSSHDGVEAGRVAAAVRGGVAGVVVVGWLLRSSIAATAAQVAAIGAAAALGRAQQLAPAAGLARTGWG
jgi:hypothetical protein